MRTVREIEVELEHARAAMKIFADNRPGDESGRIAKGMVLDGLGRDIAVLLRELEAARGAPR